MHNGTLETRIGSRPTLEALRSCISRIEGRVTMRAPEAESPALPQPPSSGTWSLGEPEIDDLLGGGLDIGGVHEIKPAIGGMDREGCAAAAWSAARAFALALAARRLAGRPSAAAMSGPAPGHGAVQLLWVSTGAAASELGGLYSPGLAGLGLPPGKIVIAEAARAADTLWAVEEGLRSSSLALVIGLVDGVGLTPARRLSLAAAGHETPCVLLTHPRQPPAAATATRWRLAPAPSRAGPFEAGAPGAACFSVLVERCRSRPAAAASLAFRVEWCDEAHRFRLAAEPCRRSARPRRALGSPR